MVLMLSLILFFANGILAQNRFSGEVVTPDGDPIEGAQIMLSDKNELVAMALTSNEGKFELKEIPIGTFLLEINALGFNEFVQTLTFSGDKVGVQFAMKVSDETMLEELVVVGDRVRQTAAGEIYTLSEKAKNSHNPFVALSEIPRLRVNIALQDIKLEDGSRPLILIDGKPINSGVNPINPEDIASVEVIEVVSARYLQKGYQSMLNIKLKQKRRPYQFYQFATRYDIPGQGMGVGYFEVGNSKISLFGRASLSGSRNLDSNFRQWQEDTGFHKSNEGTSRHSQWSTLGELLLKWQVSERDYMAAQIYGTKKNNKDKMKGEGLLTSAEEIPFRLSTNSVDDSYIITSGLYYQHVFVDKSKLEVSYGFNTNGNTLDGDRMEAYSGDEEHQYLFKYDNKRTSMNLELNYSKQWADGSSFTAGSNTRWIKDKLDQVSEHVPPFKHNRHDEYLFASYAGKVGELRYMLSAGLEGIWLEAGGERNNYWRPRFAVSGNYSINKKNSVRLNYSLTNSSPSVGQLNPYNTSSDPLVINRGNHKLTPEQRHTVSINYRLRAGRFSLTPLTANYMHYTDRITPHSYVENDVLVNSYRNEGKYDFLYLGAGVDYNFSDDMSYAYISGGRNHIYFPGQKMQISPIVNMGVWWFKRKLTVGADLSWQQYSYTPQSRTKYLKPTYAQMQVNYNITPDLYIGVALQNFTGAQKTETYSEAGTFKTYNWNRATDHGFRPWILVRYTIRKHTKEKIRLGNVLSSQEQGIQL